METETKRIDFSLPGGLEARLVSDRSFRVGERDWLLAGAYLPGLEARPPSGPVRPATHPSQTVLTVRHRESARRSVSRRGLGLTVCDRWRGRLPLDLWFLLYGLARQAWLRQHLYPVHAAAVEAAGRGAVLLVGHSGSGKTTAGLRLLERRPSLRIISGNKTLVGLTARGGLRVVAGSRTVTGRSADLARLSAPLAAEVSYGDRYAFRLAEPTAPDGTGRPRPVRAVAMVRLNDGVREAGRLAPTSALHRLFPFFMDAVNADTVLLDGAAVLSGQPPPGSAERLAAGLSSGLKRIPVVSLSGSHDFVTKELLKLL